MFTALLLWVVGVMNLCVLAKLASTFRILKMPRIDDAQNAVDMPSVSVCIAARNETHAMTQCLERVIATEYPKLEVIVLDDGSRDDTSILIKSFAHAGVRFVEGKPLQDGWLGKNHAQNVLAREASGKFVLFLDVDTLIDRHTISRLIQYTGREDASMASIIPVRNDQWHGSTIFATMRYFWTVMRFRASKPRAAANAWLIDRELLLERFANDMTLPLSMEVETTIARHVAQTKKYRLIISNSWLGLRYEKQWSSQIETSIRLLYPQSGKQVAQVALLVAALALALTPYVVSFFTPWALALVVLQYFVAYYYLAHIWVRYRFVGALILPYTLLQEIILLIMSAYKYNFGTITWKGRPITTK